MTQAQRLRCRFNIDIETCRECGDAVKVIACIDDRAVIENISAHLDGKPAWAGIGCGRSAERRGDRSVQQYR